MFSNYKVIRINLKVINSNYKVINLYITCLGKAVASNAAYSPLNFHADRANNISTAIRGCISGCGAFCETFCSCFSE